MANSSMQSMENTSPVIGDLQQLPEISLKTFLLSILLALVLAASNAYLGLKMGQTISASIPAAVFAMGVLKLFKGSNILENNIVQTAASAGEALVAGVAFTMPAMIVLHVWSHFHYWQTVMVALLGGAFGVLYAVPLRRVLLPDPQLRFPEGRAIGQVLIATSGDRSTGFRELVLGGLVSGLVQFAQTGLKCLSAELDYWIRHHDLVFGFGIGYSPALLAAGYIIGINVALGVGFGILLGWIIGVPILSFYHSPTSELTAIAASQFYWTTYVRYAGVGTMLVGGMWTLFKLARPLFLGLQASLRSISKVGEGNTSIRRTEADIPIHYLLWSLLLLVIPVVALFFQLTVPMALGPTSDIILILFALAYAFVASFIFSAICGYVAGLVGSTNSPVSGLTLAALMIATLLVKAMLRLLPQHADLVTQLSVIIIFLSGVVAGACAIGTDTIQDLKAGQIVGSTPWKQQLMMVVGVVVSALAIPLILQLLFDAYGIAGVFPRENMDPKQMLAAPQAGLMAAVVQGILQYNLSWTMVIIGAVIAVAFIVIDETFAKDRGGMPVMAVGLGIYLPLSTSTPVFLGGLVAYVVQFALNRLQHSHEQQQQAKHKTILLACGMVAGAALMGVMLAIPFAIKQSTDVFTIVTDAFNPIAQWLGLLSFLLLAVWLYYKAVKV